jgi:co-chaperonin GroES (HSP10)
LVMMLKFVIVVGLLSAAVAFNAIKSVRSNLLLNARRRSSEGGVGGEAPASSDKDFEVGVNVPEDLARQAAIYDMILVERFHAPTKTKAGLFLPKVEGKDEKHIAKIISMPTSHGLESEQGRVQGLEEIAPYKLGDVVFVRDPWGIGPKDQQVGDRCFSFHKAAQITGVIVV